MGMGILRRISENIPNPGACLGQESSYLCLNAS